MKPAAFDYYCPDTVEETVNLLSEYGDDSLLLAGGLSLGAMLNMRIARPSVLTVSYTHLTLPTKA